MLTEWRKQIDNIDEEIIKLLWERFSIVEKIWIYKKENNIEIIQIDRWQQVLADRIKLWAENGLSSELIKNAWEAIHIEAIRKEELK
ncbi:MAG: 3-deoxy-7-phosphoheptulonate synthase [uncultured bacterium (gcode 4)]|uniref:3-deoxy-7-phosphoheptulonate synthase n=1 Tax=uncultured bacterium (gcode 4) TaxID=1234023 RepID=K2GX95_9BACT|nr:MAG: 3-deoxy-7-phosphoheptulonate synthase [uncultured bacterium (gcode 4)]